MPDFSLEPYCELLMNRGTTALVVLLLIVLAACSQPATLAPSNTSVWESNDIGVVALQGSVTVVDGPADLSGAHDLEIEAAGTDLAGVEDSFHFGHVGHKGDVIISARIDEIENTHEAAKAGVMIREDLTPGAPHALMSVTADGTAEFIWRAAAGAEATTRHYQQAGFSPGWVRLVRNGTTVTGLVSADGSDWTEVHSVEIELADEVRLGIAAASYVDRLGRSDIRGLELRNGEGQPLSPPEPGDEQAPPTADNPVPPAVDEPAPPATDKPEYPVTPPALSDPSQWVCPATPLSPRYQPTMYVATDGSDSNDGRSVDRPLRTLQRAARLVRPGDVVWVRGGVYSSDIIFSTSGTSDRKIVFESYPGECAILDGTGLSGLQRVRFNLVHHNVFRNFVVRNSPHQGIFMLDSDNNVLSNIIVHDNALSGFLTMGGKNNLLTRFIAYNNYDPPYGGDADGISISTGDSNTVRECIAFGNSDDGVDSWLSTNTVIERCVSFGNGYHNGKPSGDGNGFKAGGKSNNARTVIRNSIAFHNKANGFDFNSGQGVTFENNTAFENANNGFTITGGTIRNNIAIGNGRAPFAGSNNTSAANSWELGINDPRFISTDPENAQFLSLSSNSPALGAGQSGAGNADLGALQRGQQIADWFGTTLHEASNY